MFNRRILLLATASIFLSVIGALGLRQALAGPQAPPPGGNPPAPIHTGSQEQRKAGALSIGTTAGQGDNKLLVGGKAQFNDTVSVSGSIFSTSGGFCLPSDKGSCATNWNDYCKSNDTREGCKGVQGVAFNGISSMPSGMFCGIYKYIGGTVLPVIPCQGYAPEPFNLRINSTWNPTIACPSGFRAFTFPGVARENSAPYSEEINDSLIGFIFNYTCVKSP